VRCQNLYNIHFFTGIAIKIFFIYFFSTLSIIDNMRKSNKASWTLIELITIIVLIGILAVVVSPKISVNDFKEEAELNSLIANIRYTQHKSMVSGGGWNLELQTNQYIIKDEAGNIRPLPGGENPVKVNSTIVSSKPKIYFDYLGRPDQDDNSSNDNLFDNVTINFGNSTITINKTGGIER